MRENEQLLKKCKAVMNNQLPRRAALTKTDVSFLRPLKFGGFSYCFLPRYCNEQSERYTAPLDLLAFALFRYGAQEKTVCTFPTFGATRKILRKYFYNFKCTEELGCISFGGAALGGN